MKGFGLPIILLISQLFIYRGKRNKQCIRNKIDRKVAKALLWRSHVTVSIGRIYSGIQIHILEENGLESKFSLLKGNTPQVIGDT